MGRCIILTIGMVGNHVLCLTAKLFHDGCTANKRKRQENNMGRCIVLTISMVGNHVLCFTAKLSYLNMMAV
jgi:hypothetical protein